MLRMPRATVRWPGNYMHGNLLVEDAAGHRVSTIYTSVAALTFAFTTKCVRAMRVACKMTAVIFPLSERPLICSR